MASITRKSQGSRADRREEARERLLAAIERLLETGEGFTELSVERIVSEAGISRSTFYVYFQDKGDLLSALSEDVIAQLLAVSRSWWELEDPDRGDLRAALAELIETYRVHGTLMVALAETSSYDAGVRAELHGMIREARRELAVHIERGQRHGFVHAGLDPELTAAWVAWMVDRGFYELVRRASPDEVRGLTEALTDVVWNALYSGSR